jgi:integrase
MNTTLPSVVDHIEHGVQLANGVSVDDVLEQMGKATPVNTKRTRESHLTALAMYCFRHGWGWAAMNPAVVRVPNQDTNTSSRIRITWERNYQETRPFRLDWFASHLVELNRAGVGIKTIAGRIDALNHWYKETYANVDSSIRPDNPTKHLTIENLYRSFVHDIATANTKGERKVTHAPAITIDDLRAMVRACDVNTLVGKRDRALLLLGWWGCYRRSELESQSVENISYDSKGRGFLALVYNSKTNKTDAVEKPIERIDMDAELCPVTAYESWIQSAGITSGKVFRSVDKLGRVGESISGRLVDMIVRRYDKDAKLYRGYSAHSLRAGYATWAYANGVSDALIRRKGGWSLTSGNVNLYNRPEHFAVSTQGNAW